MDRLHFLYSCINYCNLISYGIFNTLIILSEVNKNQVDENTYDFLTDTWFHENKSSGNYYP